MKRVRLFCILGTTVLLVAALALASGNLPAQKHVNGHLDQGIANIDSLPNFSGKYHADGFDPSGATNKQWVYNTVGALP
jgi:hypothetical protein